MEILIDNEPVKQEFVHWMNHFGGQDPYADSEHVGILDVLRAHFLVVDFFYSLGYGVGGVGPRDDNLLNSAVYRQFTGFDGKSKWETSYERCATLVFGLIKYHPFHDVNKRTALLVLLYFLNKLNRTPTVVQRDLENLVLAIADGTLRTYKRMQPMKEGTDEEEIRFIADYLRRNSRAQDKRYYTITYRELAIRLKEYGFCLDNPRDNYIDVCKLEIRSGVFGIGAKRQKLVKVAQIGFPGWKRQVGQKAISTVRKETKLVAERGVDSASFYRGTDPLHSLIADYVGPLERLAHR